MRGLDGMKVGGLDGMKGGRVDGMKLGGPTRSVGRILIAGGGKGEEERGRERSPRGIPSIRW